MKKDWRHRMFKKIARLGIRQKVLYATFIVVALGAITYLGFSGKFKYFADITTQTTCPANTICNEANLSYVGPAGNSTVTSNQVQVAINPSITFTSPPMVAGWNMVSIPGIPTDTAPASVFNGFDIASGVDQIFRWEASLASWIPYNNWTWEDERPENFNPIKKARAYYLLVSSANAGKVISYQGQEIKSPVTISLTTPMVPGWVQIGNPFNEDIEFDSGKIKIYKNSNPENKLSFCDADSYSYGGTPTPTSWVDATLYTFEAGSYPTVGCPEIWPNTTSFQPWRGYWLKVLSGDLTMEINP